MMRGSRSPARPGLIDAQNRWSGGNATLVQLGDITDRGADSLKIIRSLQQLAREAPGRGGRVVDGARQSRGDEPVRRPPLRDPRRVCRIRRLEVARAPRANLHGEPAEARSGRPRHQPQGSAVAGPPTMAERNPARLGRAPRRLEPDRRAWPLGERQPRCRQDRRHPVRPRRPQRRVCAARDRSDQPPGRRARCAAPTPPPPVSCPTRSGRCGTAG